MGSGQSLSAVEIDDNCLSELSSGYHTDSISELSLQSGSKNLNMSKPALRTRPSIIIGAVNKKQLNQETQLENERLKKSPGLKKVFEGFLECLNFLKDTSKRSDAFYMALDKMLDSKILKPFSTYSEDVDRMVMANKLAAIDFVRPLIDYYIYLYDDLDIESGITNIFYEEAQQIKEQGDEADFGYPLILTMREIMWNYSDGSHSFSAKLSETDIFKHLVYDLQMIHTEDKLEEVKRCEDSLFAFYSSVGILHNCARNPDIDKNKFRDVEAAQSLYPFLQSDIVYVKMVTMLAIGNIVTENEIARLEADVHVIDFLHVAILNGLKTDDRKEHGFHLSELVDGLATLAQSEDMKREIMTKKGILAAISKIMDSKNLTEVLACVKLIWELAFSPENKEILKKEEKLMSKLKALRDSKDYELKSAAESVWFILVDKDERKRPEEKEQMPAAPRSEKKQHIMISYCWSDKEIVLKIYEMLSNEGYNLWIDVNNMGQYGNLLQGMAKAIEDAYVVLICFSEKYKNSQNCRTEADYVYCLQKKIVPLKMQRGYKPDGWLGILLGAKLYIEFSPHYDFDAQMDKLRDGLKPEESVKAIESATVVSPVKDTKSAPVQTSHKRVADWTKKDVEDWMKRSNIETNSFKTVKKASGEEIEFLYRVMIKSPDTYFRWLETKLDLKSLHDLMKFDNALRALGPYMQF